VRIEKKPSPTTAKSSGSPVSRDGFGVKSVWIRSTWTAVLWLPTCAPVTELSSSRSPNVCCDGAVGLVAGRRGVRQVVGDLVLADLLRQHARRGDVEPTLHSVQSSAAAAGT
jgi:hypothetical protein